MRRQFIIVILWVALFALTACGRVADKPSLPMSAARQPYPTGQTTEENAKLTGEQKTHPADSIEKQALSPVYMNNLGAAGRRSFLRADLAVKMSEARLSERARLTALEREEWRKIALTLEDRQAKLEDAYRLPLFNLRANIETIQPAPRQREEANRRRERLLAEHGQLQTEKNKAMLALQNEAEVLFRQIMSEHERQSAERLQELSRQLTGAAFAHSKE